MYRVRDDGFDPGHQHGVGTVREERVVTGGGGVEADRSVTGHWTVHQYYRGGKPPVV